MIIVIILALVEIFTLAVLRHHFFSGSKLKYFLSIIIHTILSIWLWILLFTMLLHDSFFDNPDNIWNLMAFAGMISGVVFPRIVIIILHFSGRYFRRKSGDHIRWLTNTGLISGIFIFIVIAAGTLHGRFNFKYETVTIKIKGLKKDLDGLKIVQISDLHLAGFYHHPLQLQNVILKINEYNPDIIVNTGDFVSFGWREFNGFDTILSKSRSRYGNYAVMGNHDPGTYHPEFTEADRDNNVLILNNLVKSSGYIVLNDEYIEIPIGNSVLAIIGVTTGGRHPEIIHGDLNKATMGLDSTDLRLLLTHDPNHWIEQVSGKKTDISVTLSGHTHGMQMGIMTKRLKWSPSKYFYPHWDGLYRNGEQTHYVNRGLGVLAIPFRIWMPPAVTIITIQQK